MEGVCLNQGEGHRTRLLGCCLQQTGFDRREKKMKKMAAARMTQHMSVFASTFGRRLTPC